MQENIWTNFNRYTLILKKFSRNRKHA